MKLGITLDAATVHRMDAYADANGMTRSGLINVALLQYLNSQEAVDAIKGVSAAFNTIAEKGMVDEQTLAKLNDFEAFVRVLGYGK